MSVMRLELVFGLGAPLWVEVKCNVLIRIAVQTCVCVWRVRLSTLPSSVPFISSCRVQEDCPCWGRAHHPQACLEDCSSDRLSTSASDSSCRAPDPRKFRDAALPFPVHDVPERGAAGLGGGRAACGGPAALWGGLGSHQQRWVSPEISKQSIVRL